jgi:hypothetical protein
MKISTAKQDIYVSKAEADLIKQQIDLGAKWIDIGNERINTAFLAGIFEGEDPNYEPFYAENRPKLLISAPEQKQDWEEIKKTLEEMKKKLIEKGIF